MEDFHRKTVSKLKHLKISVTTKHMTFLSIGAVWLSGQDAYCFFCLLPTAFCSLDFVAISERLIHRHFVHVFQIASHRHAHGNARHAQTERL